MKEASTKARKKVIAMYGYLPKNAEDFEKSVEKWEKGQECMKKSSSSQKTTENCA